MSRPDELSESETEMLEAMKGDPGTAEEETIVVDEETEAEEQEATPVDRDEKGRFKSKAEESEAEADQEVEPEAKEGPKVPLQALDSERYKRQEAEGANAELLRKIEALEAMVAQTQPQQPKPQDEMPDPVVDPQGFKTWLDARDQKQAEPMNQLQALAQQQHRQQAEMSQLRNYAAAHEDHFKKEYPDLDYDGALGYAREKAAQNWKLMGATDAELPGLVAQQEAEVTKMAAQRGINPAAYIYNFAVQNGYQAPAPDTSGNITRLAEAQQRTQSTAGAGGQPRAEEYSVERLANMSEDELGKLDPAIIAKAMGA